MTVAPYPDGRPDMISGHTLAHAGGIYGLPIRHKGRYNVVDWVKIRAGT